MRYFINQITNGKTEVVYQVSDEQHAQDFCDSRNSQLADKGIPSDICSWYVSGPFDPATF
jgi:hypothetical protein